MATTNNNSDFLDMLNDTTNTGGYTAQSGRVYAPSTKVQSVKIEAILRNIKYRFANGQEVCMDGLAQLAKVNSAIETLKGVCAEFEANEKELRQARQAKQASYNNHPTIEQASNSKVVENIVDKPAIIK
jgi:hypothetical protein